MKSVILFYEEELVEFAIFIGVSRLFRSFSYTSSYPNWDSPNLRLQNVIQLLWKFFIFYLDVPKVSPTINSTLQQNCTPKATATARDEDEDRFHPRGAWLGSCRAWSWPWVPAHLVQEGSICSRGIIQGSPGVHQGQGTGSHGSLELRNPGVIAGVFSGSCRTVW